MAAVAPEPSALHGGTVKADSGARAAGAPGHAAAGALAPAGGGGGFESRTGHEGSGGSTANGGHGPSLAVMSVAGGGREGEKALYGDGEDGETTFERLGRVLRDRAFEIAHRMLREARPSARFIIILYAIEFLQVLAFPLAPSAELSWREVPIMNSLSVVLNVLTLGVTTGGFGTGAREAALVCVLAFLAILGFTIASAAMGLAETSTTSVTQVPIRLLRLLSPLVMTVLFIPVVTTLLYGFRCETGGTWLFQEPCWEGVHVISLLCLLILLSVYVSISVFVALTMVDRDPLSKCIVAAPHGRVTATSMLLKGVLCFFFTLDFAVSPLFLCILCILIAAAEVALVWQFLPYYNIRANQARMAAACVVLWAAISLVLLIAQESETGAVESSAAYVFYFAAPVVVFTGISLADYRFRSFDTDMELSSPVQVEIKARWLVQKAMKKAHIRTFSSAGQHHHHHRQHRGIGMGHTATGEGSGLDEAVLLRIESLFAESMEFFPQSRLLHLMIAIYIQSYRGNRHLELSHLSAAESKGPIIDERFMAFHRRQQFKDEEEQTSVGRMNIAMRVRFERYKREAQEYELVARTKQVDFWTHLLEKRPSLDTLILISKEILEATTKAENAYNALMRINNRSLTMIRRYAQFLLEVRNIPQRAQKLLDEADAIEDEESRQHADSAATITFLSQGIALDIAGENVAVITSSDKSHNIGEILQVNAAAIRMFGYPRKELLGKNMSVLLPEPVSSIHDHYLRRYLQTGKEVMMNTSRTVFAIHRAGHIFPALLTVRSLEGGFGGLMQELNAGLDGFIMFLSKSHVITAACQRSLSLLGVTAEDVRTFSVSLGSYIRDTERELQRIQKGESNDASSEVRSTASGRSNGTFTNMSVEMRRLHLSGRSFLEFHNVGRQFRGDHQRVDERGHRLAGTWCSLTITYIPAAKHVSGDPEDRAAVLTWRSGPTPTEVRADGRRERTEERQRQAAEATAAAAASTALVPASTQRDSDPSETGPLVRFRSPKDQSGRSLEGPTPVGAVATVTSAGEPMGLGSSRLPRASSRPGTSLSMSQHHMAVVVGDDGADDENMDDIAEELELLGHVEEDAGAEGDRRSDSGSDSVKSNEAEGADSEEDDEGGPSPPASRGHALVVTPARGKDGGAGRGSVVARSGPPGSGAVMATPMTASALDGTSRTVPVSAMRSTAVTMGATPAAKADGTLALKADGPKTKTPVQMADLRAVSRGGDEEDGTAMLQAQHVKYQSSLGSKSSSDSASTTLRRQIERNSKILEGPLKTLSRQLLIIIGVATLLNIASLVVVRVVMTQLQVDMDTVMDSGRRQLVAEEVLVETQLLKDLAQDDSIVEAMSRTLNIGEDFVFTFNRSIEFVTEQLNRLDALHRRLFLAAQAAQASDLLVDYARADVNLTRQESDGDVSMYQVNMVDAVVEYVYRGRLAAAAPRSQWVELAADNPNVWFILENGPNNLADALNHSTRIADASATSDFDEAELILSSVLFAAMGTIFLTILLAVTPVILSVERMKSEVWQLFLDVPGVVVRSLRMTTQRQLDSVVTEMEEDDDGGNVANMDETDMLESIDWARISTSTKPRRGRSFNRGCLSYCRSFLKVFASFALAILYFGLNYLWITSEVAFTVESARAQLLATQRAVKVFEVHFDTVSAMVEDGDHSLYHIERAMKESDELLFMHTVLLYGDDQLGLHSALATSTTQSQLMLEDGCLWATGTQAEACAVFYDGLLKGGLQATLQEFVEMSRRLMERRRIEVKSGSGRDQATRLRDPQLRDMGILSRWFLTAGLTYSMELHNQELDSRLERFLVLHLVATVLSILGLVAAYVLLQRPTIMDHDREIKRTRVMILLFPDEVMRSVSAIKNLVRRMAATLTNDATSAGLPTAGFGAANAAKSAAVLSTNAHVDSDDDNSEHSDHDH